MIHNILYDFNVGTSDVNATKYKRTLRPSKWSNNTYELEIDGVTEASTIFAGAQPDSIAAMGEFGITCSNYYEDTVVFTCETVPDVAVKVNIFVVEGAEQGEVEPEPPSPLFGVYWDGSVNSSMLRTDDSAAFEEPEPAVNNGSGSSPFDDYMPWKGMEIVEDAEAGTLVSIPKFWYKWTRDSQVTGDMKLQISNVEKEGFFVSPAHADRGDGSGERNVVYVGAYHCSSSNYKSTSGLSPKVSITRATARTNIHNLGSTIWQYDAAMYWTICMLYLVEFADWNSQAKIGYGCGNGSSVENSGLTDSMIYHTGTNAVRRTYYGHTRYRYIENLWSNVYTFCDGVYFNNKNVYYIKNPINFSDSTNGINIGTRDTVDGFISRWTEKWSVPTVSEFNWLLIPSGDSGSDTTYICDNYLPYSAGTVLGTGGNYEQDMGRGIFYINTFFGSSDTYPSAGCRLMKLP